MTTISNPRTESWLADWQDWRDERLAGATDEHGTAALTGTTWLSETPTAVPGLPGRWSAHHHEARGSAGAYTWAIPVGGSERFGARLVRVVAIRAKLALRVYDPAAETRTHLTGIGAFPPEASWRLPGRFGPAVGGTTRLIAHVDGARTADPVAGVVHLTVEGHEAALLAFPAADGGLQVSFADRTNGDSTAQFRFLALPRPAADGSVLVDFNRAYLPPCAFADHYLCPLPPPQNRLPVEVRAGETFPERSARPQS